MTDADSSEETLRCRLLGHKWSISPPWTGKELLHRPSCVRCGHRPDGIRITGSAQPSINHRLPGEKS